MNPGLLNSSQLILYLGKSTTRRGYVFLFLLFNIENGYVQESDKIQTMICRTAFLCDQSLVNDCQKNKQKKTSVGDCQLKCLVPDQYMNRKMSLIFMQMYFPLRTLTHPTSSWRHFIGCFILMLQWQYVQFIQNNTASRLTLYYIFCLCFYKKKYIKQRNV